MKEKYLEALDGIYNLEADEVWKTPSQVARVSSLDKNESKKALDDLSGRGLLRESKKGGSGYQMKVQGISLAEQRKLGESIE